MKKKIFIGIIVALIIIVTGICGFLYLKNNSEKPEDVLTKYMSYINEENYSEMYNLLTDDSKQSITQEDFIKRNKNIYNGIESANLTIELNEVEKIDSNSANITYTTSMDTVAGSLSFKNIATLTKKDGKYYINWSSNLIYPNLNNQDKNKS